MTFPSEQFDTNGFHSTTTNTSRITIPTGLGGYYLVSGNLRFATNGTGSRVLMLRKNGSDLLTITEYAGTASATATGRGTLIWNFAAGDYLEILAYQSSGGNLTLYAREEETPFQVQFLGV
jgi:outer membrane protein assembly factor BamB